MSKFITLFFLLFLSVLFGHKGYAQGRVFIVADARDRVPVVSATVKAKEGGVMGTTDSTGRFVLSSLLLQEWIITAVGYAPAQVQLSSLTDTVWLQPLLRPLEEVVVTGTQRTVLRSASPVPVEVYTPQFFKKNPGPAIFDILQQVNGVRPQLNCNVCNTGDIHINGLEGPYTLILIDGMPIVSSLSTVYGLSGIPPSLVERIEIIKGPAASLYGPEAIGGLINVITRHPAKAPLLSADLGTTGWGEHQLDLSVKIKAGPKVTLLQGVNGFWYNTPRDNNKDGFTDLTLQKRISSFTKLDWKRKANREAGMAFRYLYEDRWGGQMNWTPAERGGDRIYGESIYTRRFEWIGKYQLPIAEKVSLQASWNRHQQDSYYGTTPFIADQQTGFAQLLWEKPAGSHTGLGGMAVRYTRYDDNTPATHNAGSGRTRPEILTLPGIFVQDEWAFHPRHLLLGGLRWDYHPVHKSILTPRLAWKYKLSERAAFRLNAGTGFRTVNIFTEDHAALTGARTVEIRNTLKPERSMNLNLNYTQQWYTPGYWVHLEVSAWWTRFRNRIIPDYLSDPNKIIYDNLNGYALSKGISVTTRFGFTHSLQGDLGFTLQDVLQVEQGTGGKQKQRQLLTEPWSATGSLSYTLRALHLQVDYSGNVYGPMRLPVLGALDPRSAVSPVWTIQNIQFTFSGWKGVELYAGIKNLFNWTPDRGQPFLIARSQDPFDKGVQYDANGQILATPDNPYALSFDPNYVYAPNQGRRGFAGIRVKL